MSQPTAKSRSKVTGGMLVAAVTSGALTMSAMSSVPSANATCASFFGIGNSADCTSTLFSGAIAIGDHAEAHADGLFGAAVSTGTYALATTSDAFTFATAIGDAAAAISGGIFGIAVQLGQNGNATTASSGLGLNIAIGISPGNPPYGTLVQSVGTGNIAVNLLGYGTGPGLPSLVVESTGLFNVATNVGGSNNKVRATGNFNTAFSTLGSGNTVNAGGGPLAIAGSIAQTGATVTKVGPGFNINGIAVGAAAPSTGRGTAALSAATGPSPSKKRATPAAATHASTKKASSHAAASGRK